MVRYLNHISALSVATLTRLIPHGRQSAFKGGPQRSKMRLHFARNEFVVP